MEFNCFNAFTLIVAGTIVFKFHERNAEVCVHQFYCHDIFKP